MTDKTDKTDKTIKVGDKVKGFRGEWLYFPKTMDEFIGVVGNVVETNDESVLLDFGNGNKRFYKISEAIHHVVSISRRFPVVWSVNDAEGCPDYVCTTRKEARTHTSHGQRVVKYLAEIDVQDTATVKGDTIWVAVKKDGNQFIDPNEVDGFWTRQDARDWIDGDSSLKVVKYVAVKS